MSLCCMDYFQYTCIILGLLAFSLKAQSSHKETQDSEGIRCVEGRWECSWDVERICEPGGEAAGLSPLSKSCPGPQVQHPPTSHQNLQFQNLRDHWLSQIKLILHTAQKVHRIFLEFVKLMKLGSKHKCLNWCLTWPVTCWLTGTQRTART